MASSAATISASTSGTTRTSHRSMPTLVRYSAIWPMFLSLVRPDRISSPMTRRPAVMMAAVPISVMSLVLWSWRGPPCVDWTRSLHYSACEENGPRSSGQRDREDSMRTLCLAVAALCALANGSATAQGTLRIGVLNDMSGVYADDQGAGSVVAAQMAVEDFGGSVA